MNSPQHVFALAAAQEASIESDVIVLYLPQPEGVSFDARRIGKARSSWALYSRLNRMKKRHAPPAAKSLPTGSCSKRSRKSSSPKLTMELGKSRWETTSNPIKNHKQMGNGGRPTLPKRQVSIEQSSTDQATPKARQTRINQKHTKTQKTQEAAQTR